MLILKKITLTIIVFYCGVSHSQGFECDNNFSDCGTPEQSGGGGGGKGTVLIANTDLGDSYQHADDYDDDSIEDPSDNCMRKYNPQQLDYDSDGIGDMCDNCIDTWNSYQEDTDGDDIGDACDNDIDGDGILNTADSCPYQWGNSYCLEEQKQNHFKMSEDDIYDNHHSDYIGTPSEDHGLETNNQGCHMSASDKLSNQIILAFVVLFLFTLIIYKRDEN